MGGSALLPELYGIPAALPVLWLLTGAGWTATAVGLYRGLSGFGRRTALIAHVMTPPGAALVCMTWGLGSLFATIALAAEWWALLLATGLRPERLVTSGTLPRLAAWSALTALGVLGGSLLIL